MDFCKYIAEIDNIDVKCNSIRGFESVGYIMKREDIDFANVKFGYTGDVEIPSTVVTGIALKDGKKAYKINQLKDAFADTAVSLNVGDYRNGFTNTLNFKIFDNGPKVAKIVNGLANGEYVVILEQKDKSLDTFVYGSGESTYRIFGLDSGLVATATDNSAYDDAIGNGWSITMEEANATSSEYFLFVGAGSNEPNINDTKQVIESLTV